MRVIGLISGTSVDGIDAALIDLSGTSLDLQVCFLAGATYAYPDALRQKILAVCAGESLSVADLAELDDAIAAQFAQAAIEIQQGYAPAELIGSHGQTVFHRPPTSQSLGYSLQLGRGAVIAELTGIPTVSNFRAADIAAGGQGAPLVPAIDRVLLRHPTRNRCIQNIGGIGNVAYLPAINHGTASALGWDTGPGNVLIDLAVQQFTEGQQHYDADGAWAAQGKPCHSLVAKWLQQDFFQTPPPKSTGRELFGREYLQQCLQDAADFSLSQADILATLTELTAASIALSYNQFLPHLPDEVILCGGGSRNAYLRERLQANLELVSVGTTDQLNLNADYKEAIAFAVLAYWRLQSIPGNLPEVTGARQAVPLGEIHMAVAPSRR
ncbi:anhydro-N-acetylmuramic acid kinase [Leptolyngbya ohadii]|uniref:anhydro-N-acetylmuramic acid kinase n=1 Tax=Leptolyngbya ohadii TaxID=1962290 RepID=UPI000B598C0A|nr:anhydro-N-acetylmuramic acid kinase [Leptolyngbya ohadii]